jgi:hypothetical protein
VIRKTAAVAVAVVAAMAIGIGAASAQSQTSKPFSGAKVNAGRVMHSDQNGKHVLTLSGDFQVPDTPDPHWQIVDGKGRVFLLERLKVKGAIAGLAGDKVNMSITLPGYIEDVAKVQIYCAWAEVVLGETTFDSRIMTVAGK